MIQSINVCYFAFAVYFKTSCSYIQLNFTKLPQGASNRIAVHSVNLHN